MDHVVKRLWSQPERFDFTGEFVKLAGAMSQPKPIQQPFPALMNAGGSDTGRHFVAKHCDLAFVAPRSDDEAALKEQVDAYRQLARERSGREVQVWTSGYVAQAANYDDALKYVHYYAVEHGDDPHVDAFIAESISRSRVVEPAALQHLRYAIKAGIGGVPLLGTPEAIAAKLERVARLRNRRPAAGVDGLPERHSPVQPRRAAADGAGRLAGAEAGQAIGDGDCSVTSWPGLSRPSTSCLMSER